MDKLLEFLKDEEYFVRPLTLISGIIAILLLEASLDDFVKEFVTQGYWRRLILYVFFEVIFISSWSYRRFSLPRVPKGKIGLVIAVTTETMKSRVRLRTDLVERLRQSIG